MYCCNYYKFEYKMCDDTSNDIHGNYCVIHLNMTLIYDIITIYNSEINNKNISP